MRWSRSCRRIPTCFAARCEGRTRWRWAGARPPDAYGYGSYRGGTEVIQKAAKNHLWCREHSCTPHDVYDRWVELFGSGIDAFYPVLKTADIGNIGTICCSDGEYPEAVRALAFNGAEVVYRPSEAVPLTNFGGSPGGSWMVQNRAHAEFNNLYMLCPNIAPVYLSAASRHPIDIAGGNSHIIGFRGEVLSHCSASANNTMISAIIDIEALSQFRAMNHCIPSNTCRRMSTCRRMGSCTGC